MKNDRHVHIKNILSILRSTKCMHVWWKGDNCY